MGGAVVRTSGCALPMDAARVAPEGQVGAPQRRPSFRRGLGALAILMSGQGRWRRQRIAAEATRLQQGLLPEDLFGVQVLGDGLLPAVPSGRYARETPAPCRENLCVHCEDRSGPRGGAQLRSIARGGRGTAVQLGWTGQGCSCKEAAAARPKGVRIDRGNVRMCAAGPGAVSTDHDSAQQRARVPIWYGPGQIYCFGVGGDRQPRSRRSRSESRVCQ